MFNEDIVRRARDNTFFREVLATGPNCQIVVMRLAPGEDIGPEKHDDVDQVFVIVQGTGEAIVESDAAAIAVDRIVHVPAGAWHNVVNTGSTDLRLYTIYAPPEHAPGTIHRTKAEAVAAHEAERTREPALAGR
jgi:mannose-6-phosphate isomerase-like protein (cupin superfamily)